MTIEQRNASDMEGFDEFIEALTTSKGVKGIIIPPKVSSPPLFSDLRFLWNEENPRLVFAPLCEHRATGFWAIAVFQAVDTDEDGERANLRASLALSIVAGQPVVIHGDFALLCTEGWGDDPENPKFTGPVSMPRDIADDLKKQFSSPENFISGPIVGGCHRHGVDPAEIANELAASYPWEESVADQESEGIEG